MEKLAFSRLLIKGVVQGVGFRPTVCRVANSDGVVGFVVNTGVGVEITIPTSKVKRFLENLNVQLPPLAKIDSVEIVDNLSLAKIPTEFSILVEHSNALLAGDIATEIPVDSCVCSACIDDVFNPKSEYYLYPFTNCCDCGARYTAIEAMPFERFNTSMKDFSLCRRCEANYNDLNNRRYHAQMICCKDCGPKFDLELDAVANYIQDGKIVALKTIGGYVLIADAKNDDSINRLRVRKRRKSKPFALMATNLDSIRQYCIVTENQAKLLASKPSPIVILKQRVDGIADGIATAVAPGLDSYGFMLPSNPIYYLLFYYLLGSPKSRDWFKNKSEVVLVVTSANLSGGSIISNELEAKEYLSDIADIIVSHDRKIVMRADDSVILPIENENIIIRRARGLVPSKLQVPCSLPQVMGCGSQIKNTVCFSQNNCFHLSQYIGNLDSEHTIKYYHEVVNHYKRIYNFIPELLVSDLHPDFYVATYFNDLQIPCLQLQHHFAHLASGLALLQAMNVRLQDQVLGVIFDGYGYGIDGSSWGGELISFKADELEFRRISSIPKLKLIGGDVMEREPWRLCLLWCLENRLKLPAHLAIYANSKLIDLYFGLLVSDSVSYTTSLGRIFSLVSAIVGVCAVSSYEAEAVMRLEAMVTNLIIDPDYIRLNSDNSPDINFLLLRVYHIANFENDIKRAVNVFYGSLGVLLAKWILAYVEVNNTKQVIISGGCFQSRYILPLIKSELLKYDIDLLIPNTIPVNDECISLGQAWYGAQYLLKSGV